jgi:peptide chain release factor 1
MGAVFVFYGDDMDLIGPLEALRHRFERVQHDLSLPETVGNPMQLRQLSREHSRLVPIMAKFKRYQSRTRESRDLATLAQANDPEMQKMAQEELAKVTSEIESLAKELQLDVLPKDPNEDRNIILEIRAGAGGDEAGLFAADLLRMYQRYSEAHGWVMEPLDSSISERGGLKEIAMQISGPGVWAHFKYERGVHRVQRVPATEASGRIHTSTATVAVLPEAEELDLKIDLGDLRIDTYRASGAGGQHINKTDSAVRITHLPTGLVVACQDERSQIKNRAKAMKLLRSRLLEQIQEKQAKELSQARRSQVGTGDRSEKIRTYNYPQDRITDHRINFNVHNLPGVMEGNLDALIKELQKREQERLLAELASPKP